MPILVMRFCSGRFADTGLEEAGFAEIGSAGRGSSLLDRHCSIVDNSG
jgi:hypothetical protein